MTVQAIKLITKPSTVDSDILNQLVPQLGASPTIYFSQMVATNNLINNEPELVIVVVFS